MKTQHKYEKAMLHTMYNANAFTRKEIPPNLWVAIGWFTNLTGKEKLRKLLSDYPEK